MFRILLMGIRGTKSTAERVLTDWMMKNPFAAFFCTITEGFGPVVAGSPAPGLRIECFPIGPVVTRANVDAIVAMLNEALQCAHETDYGTLAG